MVAGGSYMLHVLEDSAVATVKTGDELRYKVIFDTMVPGVP